MQKTDIIHSKLLRVSGNGWKYEKKVGIDSKKVKIPNVCDVFGIHYISLFELMKLKKVNLIIELNK